MGITCLKSTSLPPFEMQQNLKNGRGRIAMRTEEEMVQLENGGYRYCFTCADWCDDTDCYQEDHSRHCGHHLKPLGMLLPHSNAMGKFVFICNGDG